MKLQRICYTLHPHLFEDPMNEAAPSVEVESILVPRVEADERRILVVDDEIYIATLVSEMIYHDLQELPVQAHSAEEAIAELERGDFCLVISDIRMPGMGGFGLLEWIQAKRPALKDRFLFVTGYAGGPEADRILSQYGVPVIRKPFSCADLIQRCRDLLDGADSCDEEVHGRSCLAS